MAYLITLVGVGCLLWENITQAGQSAALASKPPVSESQLTPLPTVTAQTHFPTPV